MQESRSDYGTRERDDRSAWRDARSHLRFWLVAVTALVLDLWSKQYVFANLGPDEVASLIPRVLEARRSLNDGAVFGAFTGYVGVFIAASLFALAFVLYLFANSARRQWALHISLGLILSGAMGNLYDRAFQKADIATIREPGIPEWSRIGRRLETADASIVEIGEWPEGSNPRRHRAANVEFRRQGVVRDFLKFIPRFPSWVPYLGGKDVWPWVFNVADAALVCGVILLLFGSSFRRPHAEVSEPRTV